LPLVEQERGFDPKLSRKLPHWTTIPANIHIMEQTEHLRALHTIIRDKATPLGDFVFFSNRLSRLVRCSPPCYVIGLFCVNEKS